MRWRSLSWRWACARRSDPDPCFHLRRDRGSRSLAGAVPVFVDVHADTFDLIQRRSKRASSGAPRGLRPVGVIAVDLFGQPADYDAIREIAEAHGSG